uniref:Obg domain-containing protein n=1 Tax=Meloidogyne javanica TaxID=6303 RepID=A0A915MQJ9_MELJA
MILGNNFMDSNEFKCRTQVDLYAISETEKIENYDISHKAPVLPKKLRSTGEPLDFVDYLKVVCSGGNGGDGVISFMREKNIEFGGPDGGNGGNGGHVIFKANSKVSDLSRVELLMKAENGQADSLKVKESVATAKMVAIYTWMCH